MRLHESRPYSCGQPQWRTPPQLQANRERRVRSRINDGFCDCSEPVVDEPGEPWLTAAIPYGQPLLQQL